MPNRYILKTLGCKANLYDSHLIEQKLQEDGWLPSATNKRAETPSADVQLCVINSCTVTDEADRQTRKLAARLARENPLAKILVTGCAAEINPEEIARSPGVHFVVGNQDKN